MTKRGPTCAVGRLLRYVSPISSGQVRDTAKQTAADGKSAFVPDSPAMQSGQVTGQAGDGEQG